MKPIILYRAGDHTDEEELEAAREHFEVTTTRARIPTGRLVVPRYASLPFHRELEEDVAYLGSRLINSTEQHNWVADIRNWATRGGKLDGMTPATYTTWAGLPEGQYVVKGTTSSRKGQWSTRMFCPTVGDIPRVAASLLDDQLIADQGVVVRDYVPLRRFGTGINGMPISNEWRVFGLDGKILDYGYYWASEPQYERSATFPEKALFFVEKALKRIGKRVPFVVVDVAETEAGGWIIVELNDGCLSGLSMIPPGRFYGKLARALAERD